MVAIKAHFYFRMNATFINRLTDPYMRFKLVLIGINEYRVDGVVEFRYPETKKVIVDGEEYTKREIKESVLDLSESFNEITEIAYLDGTIKKVRMDWQEFVFDQYGFMGIPKVTIWDYTGFDTTSPLRQMSHNWSTSSSRGVNIHELFFHMFLKGKALDYYYGRHRGSQVVTTHSIKDLISYDGSVWVVAWDGYGFCFHISFSIFEFLSLDFSKLNKWHLDYAIRYIPEISDATKCFTDEQKLLIAARLFDQFINISHNAN